jgi:hypothetical protein
LAPSQAACPGPLGRKAFSYVSDGVFLPGGAFRALPPPNYQQLLLLFRHKLMRQLLKLEKITETTVEILDRFRRPHAACRRQELRGSCRLNNAEMFKSEQTTAFAATNMLE